MHTTAASLLHYAEANGNTANIRFDSSKTASRSVGVKY